MVDPKRKLRICTESDTTVASCGTSDSIRDHWESNARLIAAAPELLEALKTALHGLQTAQTYLYENGMTIGAVEQAHRRAFAAIAKAEGK